MRLTILGMNGPFPAPGGATSGYFLAAGESHIAIDMGSGVLSRLTALTPPEELTAVLLSHWHFDHSADMLVLIYRLAACAREPLHIYAPADMNSPVRKIVQDCKELVLHDIAPGETFQVGQAQVQMLPSQLQLQGFEEVPLQSEPGRTGTIFPITTCSQFNASNVEEVKSLTCLCISTTSASVQFFPS